MPGIDIVVESKLSRSTRVKQLEVMFDVPASERVKLSWAGDFPFDAEPWNVGLIVGPSGSGKSTIARHVFGQHVEFSWDSRSVIDDFKRELSIEIISQVCQAVGFNTVPAWIRPYAVLSTGERFRVDLARRLLEIEGPIVCDEFTSVVDRQVAQIGSHAVQRFARKHGRKFVAVSCHYDIVDWLQPDWILEPATMTFTRRLLQRRPSLDARIQRVEWAAWKLFAPFHYLTAGLHRAAACYVLFVSDRPASFAGMLHRPHPRVRDIMGCSRLVTLPDWQGLGLAMILIDTMGAAYKAIGKRLHTYPAHPSLIRSFDHSGKWVMKSRPSDSLANIDSKRRSGEGGYGLGGRPCAVFCYAGEVMDVEQAESLLARS